MNVGGRNTYWGGDCCFVDNCDWDKVSIIELDVLIKENLGHSTAPVYYLKVWTEEDLVYIEKDSDLLKYLQICIKKSRLVELYCDHPPGVNLLESQASGCTQETSGQGLDGEEEEFVDSKSEEDETEVDFFEDSEEDDLGYDNHLSETRNSD